MGRIYSMYYICMKNVASKVKKWKIKNKIFSKLGLEIVFLNMMEGNYGKPSTIVVNVER